jgi:tripartite motif-containing protein 71
MPAAVVGRRRRYPFITVLLFSIVLLLESPRAFAGPPPPEGNDNTAHIALPRYQFTVSGQGSPGMLEPSGLTIDAQQQVYIADCARDNIEVFTIAGLHVKTIGGSEPQMGSLRCPQGLALDPSGRLLVIDTGHRRVQAFDSSSGRFLATIIGDKELVWPYGISTDGRTIAISDPGTEGIHFYDMTGRYLRSCGTVGDRLGNFANPLGVTLDTQGNIYVADQQNSRIQQLRPDCSVIRAWGKYGGWSGELAEPADVRFVDGQVYVADLTNHRLQVFDANGRYLYQWGHHPATAHEGNGYTHYPMFMAPDSRGTDAVVCEPFELRCQTFDLNFVQSHFRRTSDLAFWDKYPRFHYGTGIIVIVVKPPPIVATPASAQSNMGVAIAEPDLSRVVTIDWSGRTPKMHAAMGGFGSQPGLFKQPSGMVQDPTTLELYISDAHNHRIQVFTVDGHYVRSFGTFGMTPGYMNGPGGLDFDDEGHLLIAQTHAQRIDVYTKQGEFLRSIGGPGEGPLQFNHPIGLVFNRQLKRIYVADSFNQRIQILSADGRYISEFGGHGNGPGQLIDALFLAIDKNNNIYVTDTASDRVQKFNQDGHFIKQWGGWGSEPGQFYKPKGIAVMEDRLLVLDFGNHRGQIFTLEGEPIGTFGEGVLYLPPATANPSAANVSSWLIVALLILVPLLCIMGTFYVVWLYRRRLRTATLAQGKRVAILTDREITDASNGNHNGNAEDVVAMGTSNELDKRVVILTDHEITDASNGNHDGSTEDVIVPDESVQE